MWPFKNKQKTSTSEAEKKSERSSLIRAVHYHMVDRRQYQRVQYPAVGALGSLPAIECQGYYLDPLNISLGGLLLLNPPFKENKPGQKFEFRMVWKRKKLEIVHEAELLRINQGHWHFRFCSTDRRYFAEFPRIFKSGVRGTTTVEFKQNQVPPGEHIVELWMSEHGDYVIFQSPPSEKTEAITIHFDGQKFKFLAGGGFLLGTKHDAGEMIYSIEATQDWAEELLVFLVNFKQPSPRVRRLISEIIDFYFRAPEKQGSKLIA